MSSASGIKYKNIEHVVEKIADIKANQYKSISYFDREDIKQEIRLKCFNVSKKYNPNKQNANILNFLSTCADNRLKDIRRKHVANGINDDKYIKSKITSSYVFEVKENMLIDYKFDNTVNEVDFRDFVYFHLPSGLISIYLKFENSNFDPKSLRHMEKASLFPTLIDVIIDWGKEG